MNKTEPSTAPYCCPTCQQTAEHLLTWKFSGLNDSVFNYDADFAYCSGCGLIWITNMPEYKLDSFYQNECMYFANPHFDIAAPANISKYEYYYSILEEFSLTTRQIADIGCGRGGFVHWIAQNHPAVECCGIDVDVKSLPDTPGKSQKFLEGTAKALPFQEASQDTLTFFHVFEHLIQINEVMLEIKRVVKDGGYIIIEVPDTENYQANANTPGFLPGIREHILHYTPKSLKQLLNRHGFSVQAIKQATIPAPEFSYSSLVVVARKGGEEQITNPANSAEHCRFFKQEQARMLKRASELANLIKKSEQVVFWGVSNQLMSILPHLKEYFTKITLCDKSKDKQGSACLSLLIHAPEECISPQGILIISSPLHTEIIKKDALQIGWKSDNIISLY